MNVTLLPPYQPVEQQKHGKKEGDLWTVAEFHRAAAAGAFADPDRLEMIHGRLVRLMQGGRHANLRVRVSRRLRRALDPPLFVRDENPLHFAFNGELIPDLMLTYQEEYEGRHPEPDDVALLVEVADSSVDYDLGEKALLYAQGGIGDYWVVLAEAQAVVVHRQPTSEGYQQVTRLTGADTLAPLVAPEIIWMVSALLGREGAPEEN